MKDRTCAVVGAYEHPLRKAGGKSNYQLVWESSKAALADAGLTFKDVDGLCWATNGDPAVTQCYNMTEYLNIRPKFVDSTKVGGASFLSYVNHAESMIMAGKASVVLIAYGSTTAAQQWSLGTGRITQNPAARGSLITKSIGLQDSFEEIYGTTIVGFYGMLAQRHMAQYGTKPEQLAEIAVVTRRHAAWNPNAPFRDPITVEDVLNSPMISSPLHRLDCCLATDGGGAIVVASPEVARNCAKPPVWVLGCAEACDDPRLGRGDITVSSAAQSGPRALAAAGVKRSDLDLLMIYDSFTITVLTALEDIGFCKKGEGGPFVESGRLAIDGEFPLNTDGGGLSSTHPGMRGIFTLIEATRQLRGDFSGTPRQVPNCRLALAHGSGGCMAAKHGTATVILGRD